MPTSALASGSKLGPYEIIAPLGAGGMGEVYRARDPRLGRDVALKVLPAAFAQDGDRMARFQREAQVLASLNHPSIAALYGLEETAGVLALVMELVEGPTLAERLKSGDFPFDEALPIAKQIAEALEAAHERGIIHRDLKPANIKITPDGKVKVLDFGLAKALDTEVSASNISNSPTLTQAGTQAGVILGTAAYMSPEQAKGRPVDRRADIWSFGVVLFEMLTGKRAFEGDSVAEVISAVLTREPEIPDALPPHIARLLRRCLTKDPRQRLRDIGEARIALESPEATLAPASAVSLGPVRKGLVPWALAGAFVLAIVAALGWWTAWRSTRPVDHPLLRLSVDLGPDAVVGAHITAAISPDGTRLAFPARGPNGTTELATRLLDQPQATLLSGTEGAVDPFFSPDGEWIGFFAEGKMKKVSVQGSAVITLCDAPSGRGAAWGEDGNMIATLGGYSGVGLSRVPAAGGTPQAVTSPAEKGEATHRWPQILPGGQAVLFMARTCPNMTIPALRFFR